MLKIRLQRVGRKNDPSFRVIVGEDSNAAQSGKFLEILGNYDARNDRLDLKADRIKHWLAQGAKATSTIHNLLITGKVIEGTKIDVAPKAPAKSVVAEEAPKDKEATPTETPAPAETPAPEAPTEPSEAPVQSPEEVAEPVLVEPETPTEEAPTEEAK